jgi:hypothetical protein
MPYSTTFSFDSVHVIESLPVGEFQSGRELFETVLAPAAANDPGFVVELHSPKSAPELVSSLRYVEQVSKTHARSPIVHLETHGNVEGLGTADGSFLEWSELAPLLLQINKLTRVNTLVMAVMCRGWHMSSVLRATDRAPAFGILGTLAEPGGGHLLQCMQAFYRRLLHPGHDLKAALDEANSLIPSEADHFHMEGAELLLCRVLRHYFRNAFVDESKEERATRLLAKFAEAKGLPLEAVESSRQSIEAQLDDCEFWFNHYKTRFLMLDLFPANASRFRLGYPDCGPDDG